MKIIKTLHILTVALVMVSGLTGVATTARADGILTLTPNGHILSSGSSLPLTTSQKFFTINPSDTFTGYAGSRTSGKPHIEIGNGTFSGDDSALLINRNMIGTDLFSHAVRDESTFTSAITGAYASYDSVPVISGTIYYNHLTSFQARSNYSGSGHLNTYQAFVDMPTFNGPVDNRYGYRVEEWQGSGSVSDNIGLLIDPLTRGAGTNWAIRTDGTTPSLFGGNITAGNIKSNDGYNSESFGIGAGNPSSNFYAALFGHNTGLHLSGSSNNTFFGSRAGTTETTGGFNTYLGGGAGFNNIGGNNNIFVGFYAGFNQFSSNRVIIDGLNRGDAASELNSSLIVGQLDTNRNNQTLRVNAGLILGTTSVAPSCTSTTRGEFWYTPGDAGIKDSVQICAKDASNVYAWRTIY